jgi:hypothetical protein
VRVVVGGDVVGVGLSPVVGVVVGTAVVGVGAEVDVVTGTGMVVGPMVGRLGNGCTGWLAR